MHTDILIVGGGLSGLALATRLYAEGRDVTLIEARPRFGGRICGIGPDAAFDLGPAWFWPGQPRIAALIRQLNLKVYEQHWAGTLSFEDARGRVERGAGFASMQGSLRLEGGFAGLISALVQKLPQDRLHHGWRIARIESGNDRLHVIDDRGRSIQARQVVLALPPRLAAETIQMPDLPDAARARLAATPTWMAGQAKVLATYEAPFWRDAGLSGDAMSRHGPMVEIHDASLPNGPAALFGFVGLPAAARTDISALRAAALAQFARLFGPQAAEPLALHIKDWAADAFTATPADAAPLGHHPAYGPAPALDKPLAGKLFFSGSETAREFGGFLEGALEAADITYGALAL
ncbi:NAD(P)/FAD-dependent oxidoreductase [Cognatishimia sp. SS12]|uniref:flavin monoamine oxidase family protein n=1 Tax=Cognatishimia sp. SS12 TaxID=2979465 RepID=UPI00232D85DA|nr:NAD(P)/FAD-dependent oxidoreductase [Cognatishimia sp. SS12]MDC0737042.1 NAD(P)/FAD-dependent oxidoreductase [Cognatishimia sp. SS12]